MNRRFLRFLIGHGTSEFGNFLSAAALGQLVYLRLGGKSLGMLHGAGYLVPILAGPLLGVFADHRPARRTMIAANVAMALLTCGLLLQRYDAYLALKVALTIFSTLFGVAYNRFFPRLVEPAYLEKASGWVSTVRQLVSTLGVLAGSYLAVTFGPKVFLIDAMTFVVSAAVLAGIPVEVPGASRSADRGAPAGVARGLKADLGAGVRHLVRDRETLIVLLAFLLGLSCWSVRDIAVWAVALQHLGLPERWAGSYLSAAFVGELIMAIAVARGSVRTALRPTRTAVLACGLLALSMVGAGLSSALVPAYLFKVLEGMASLVLGVTAWNVLTLRATDALRGRVSGLIQLVRAAVFMGGALLTGFLVDALPARILYLVTGSLVLAILAAAMTLVRLRAPAPEMPT